MHHHKAHATSVRAAAGIGAFLLASALIVRTSEAAFTATADNTGNAWTTGSVTLTDDDSGTVLFDGATPIATGATDTSLMKPGTIYRNCIDTIYSGSLLGAADVSPVTFHVDGVVDTTGLEVRVHLGDAGSDQSFGDCTGFSGTEATSGWTPLGALPTAFATGLDGGAGAWVPDTGDTVRSWMIETRVTDGSTQGGSASADFNWEVQSA